MPVKSVKSDDVDQRHSQAANAPVRMASGLSARERFLWAVAGLAVAVVAVVVDRQTAVAPQGSATCVPNVASYAPAAADAASGDVDYRISKYGHMQMEWQTPIYRIDMNAFEPNLPSMNKAIHKAVLDTFAQLNATAGAQNAQMDWKASGVNQAFFEWQRDGGWEATFASLPPVKKIQSFFQQAADVFLANIGMDQQQIASRSRQVQGWATVNYGGIGHMQHVHPNNMVSGVFYVSVPKTAGPLVFYDPRGPRPPFDQQVIVQPREGLLVIFPSWLSHQVMPTPGTLPRISLAFNVEGDWEDTSNVKAEFDLQRG